jgi:hypothetical protein
MRKLVTLVLLLLAGASVAPLVAQTSTTPFPVPVYYASAFGQWNIQSQSPNNYTFQGRLICQVSAQNTTFFTFNTNAPVLISDQNTAKNEVVTPSAVVNTAGSCGVSVAPSNQHYTFSLKSGTAGLQEAINAVATLSSVPATIQLDRNWWAAANQIVGTSGNTILGAATGNYGAIITDITAAPYQSYIWNGTAYVSGTWVNTAPAAAAGAGAGTSPTISIKGTALSGTVSLLTGSATTTGTLFTLTFGSNASVTTAQFLNAGTCTVVSQPGATNSYTTFTEATTYPSSTHRLSTVTVNVTAPVAATQYYFNYTCF